MPVLLDTTGMSARQRSAAMGEFFETQSSMPMRFECERPLQDMQMGMSVSEVGDLTVHRTWGAALRVVRGKRELGATTEPYLDIAYFDGAVTTGVTGNRGDRIVGRAGEILPLDLTTSLAMDWPDRHDNYALPLTHARIGLPTVVIRRAVSAAASSPLLGLLQRHVARLCLAAPALEGSPAARVMAETTVDLVRAFVLTAGGSPDERAEAMEDTLPMRVERYMRDHLAEPALSAAQIAAAHFVSVRHLYNLWSAGHEQGLAEWLMDQRLDRAGRELARSTLSIAAVAHTCRFADASHFSRRFRQRYGMSPRDWRSCRRDRAGGTTGDLTT